MICQACGTDLSVRESVKRLEGEQTTSYGHDQTWHGATYVDVGVHRGRVVEVWFRCLSFPFEVQEIDSARAAESDRWYRENPPPQLVAVEVVGDLWRAYPPENQ